MTLSVLLLTSGDLEGDDYPIHLLPEYLPPAGFPTTLPSTWLSLRHFFRFYLTHPAFQPISIARSVQPQLSHSCENGKIWCQDPLPAPTAPTWFWFKLTDDWTDLVQQIPMSSRDVDQMTPVMDWIIRPQKICWSPKLHPLYLGL